MNVSTKPDFRKTLNYMLSIYYQKGSAILIHMEAQDIEERIPEADLNAGFSTLLQDGYIDQLMPDYSFYPLGAITGKGRIFYEAGGYKDETTKVDKIIKWGKNHKIISYLIVAVIILTSALGLIELISKVLALFSPSSK